MTSKYTIDDLPMIMNNIGWQLKRIADAMEKHNQVETPTEKPKVESSGTVKIKAMLAAINKNNYD